MSDEPGLKDKVLALDEALAAARLPHAFGGALALAYYAEPRSTLDIDCNIFVEPSAIDRVEAVLAPLGIARSEHADPQREGQGRWWWGSTPVDLFFTTDPIHEAMADRRRRVPFADRQIPILAPEHLLVCKAAFGRPKDWIDIEQMLVVTDDLDPGEVRRWSSHLFAPDDPRSQRVEELLARASG
ncbi:MAG: hypothetical protein ACR2NA_05265 [Solirubrobacterales bacterium]